MQNMARVNVKFFIAGDGFPLDSFTREMGIKPTKMRYKKDWPDASIRAGIAEDTWLLKTEKEDCRAVSSQFDKMQALLSSKVGIIKGYKEKWKLSTNFTIVIQSDASDMPEMFLSEEKIAFIALMGAELGFEMYIN